MSMRLALYLCCALAVSFCVSASHGQAVADPREFVGPEGESYPTANWTIEATSDEDPAATLARFQPAPGTGDGGPSNVPGSTRGSLAIGLGTNTVLSSDARRLPSTDGGGLLKKSSILGVAIQARNPVVSDTRVRSNAVGQVLASGSYWIPARMDLDTLLNKIDSRIIAEMTVVKGPYTALAGPGFNFVEFDLLPAPRYGDEYESHGSTSFDFKANGDQWYGRQSVWGGASDWGYRVSYGHRTGNDYRTGNGNGAGFELPSSYNSRDWDLALGWDPTSDSTLEVNVLRLDQTGVEYPGYVYDMDYLVTDSYEMVYRLNDQEWFDEWETEAWYNDTRFAGNANRPGKRRQIPELSIFLLGLAFTDADAMSSGFSSSLSWGDADVRELTLGLDLRFVKQQLDEREVSAAGTIVERGIPKSTWTNPGIFAQWRDASRERTTLIAGGRFDWLATDKDFVNIDGVRFVDRTFGLGMGFLTLEQEINCSWTANAGVGFAMRPPTLTELYSDRATISMLQHGINNTIGNQSLAAPKRLQADLGLTMDQDRYRGGVDVFYAWSWDQITYEGGAGDTFQFVNTDRATLWGAEAYAEYDLSGPITAFATLSYVEGQDLTFNKEPLPSIPPLESRLGLRIQQDAQVPRWSVEAAARVVDAQDRAATLLLENPTAGFTVYELRGYWNVTDRLMLIGGVENLTDRFYREHLDIRTGRGVYQPGVNAYVGSELTY